MFQTRASFPSKCGSWRRILCLIALLLCGPCLASQVVLNRNGAYVAVESYAPNIVRITIATDYATAAAAPGYGFIASADSHGFEHTESAGGDDFRSSALQLHVDAQPLPGAPSFGERYFAPSLPPVALEIRNARSQTVLAMTGWQMAPRTVNGEHTFQVGASFTAPADEHFYGLGQNQEGILDLRGRTGTTTGPTPGCREGRPSASMRRSIASRSSCAPAPSCRWGQ